VADLSLLAGLAVWLVAGFSLVAGLSPVAGLRLVAGISPVACLVTGLVDGVCRGGWR
jgi:hypothetical protein